MLKWLFRKRIERTQALESYLSHFDAGELAYLKNITLMGRMPTQYPSDTLSANDRILLCAYIQAEWLVVSGQLKADPMARSVERASYNIELAKDATRLIGAQASKFFEVVSPHRLSEPDLDAEQEDRLGAHAIVLERIYRNPRNAPTLPELDDIGEGIAWLQFP